MATEAKIQSLQRHFGNGIDRDVLESVLAVNDGDVNLSITFLTGQQGDYIVDPNQPTDGLPNDYPGKVNTGAVARSSVKVEPPTANTQKILALKKLFLQESLLQEHFAAQEEDFEQYASTLLRLLFHRVEIVKGCRSRILATCWARRCYALPSILLKHFEELFALPEVLRSLKLLDARRQIRAIEKRIARLQKQGTVKARKMGQLKSAINDLQKEALEQGSVSGALCKKIKAWVGTIDTEKLTFFALNMPREPWRELADIVHLNPSSFKLDWFLGFVFGAPAPQESILTACEGISTANVVEILQKHEVPYSYLRLHVRPLPDAAKAQIALYAPIDTLIWYHEELSTVQVNNTIQARLQAGESVTFSYGKLMERLLYFKRINAPFYETLIPLAEDRLSKIDLELEPPVSVLGDASYSMDVAIRTSTIISSVLTVLTAAELKFFHTRVVDPPCYPASIRQVIQVAENVKADGMTAPAAGLWPYYQQKKRIKFFVVVTDEIENIKFDDRYYFPDLFQKYYEEVYPAKIVFVSFLENPSQKGRMVTSLENMGFDVLQFRLDGNRPDLTKMDTLLGLLASEASTFSGAVTRLATLYKKEGLDAVINALMNPVLKKKKRNLIQDQQNKQIELPDSDDEEEGDDKDVKKEEGGLVEARREFSDSIAAKEQEIEKLKNELNVLQANLGSQAIPQDFLCPITQVLFQDPVIAEDGHSYERSAISSWFESHNRSPMTGQVLDSKHLIPNHAIRKAIAELLERGASPDV